MELYQALATYAIFVVVVSVVLYYNLKITAWSAASLSLIMGLIYLLVAYRPTELIREQEPILIMVYLGVLVLTPVTLLIYILSKGLFDYRTTTVNG